MHLSTSLGFVLSLLALLSYTSALTGQKDTTPSGKRHWAGVLRKLPYSRRLTTPDYLHRLHLRRCGVTLSEAQRMPHSLFAARSSLSCGLPALCA